MASTGCRRTETLGGALALRRLEHRATRLRLVLLTLRERGAANRGRGHLPLGLQRAIRDFSRELARVEAELDRARTQRDRPGGDDPLLGGVQVLLHPRRAPGRQAGAPGRSSVEAERTDPRPSARAA